MKREKRILALLVALVMVCTLFMGTVTANAEETEETVVTQEPVETAEPVETQEPAQEPADTAAPTETLEQQETEETMALFLQPMMGGAGIQNEEDLIDAIANAGSGDTITVSGEITLTKALVIPAGKEIILDGGGTLVGANNSSTVEVNGSLKLNNITVTHEEGEEGTGIVVGAAGELIIDEGALVTGNTGSTGGGVYNEGKLEMLGGVISYNEAQYGGGIYTLTDITISGGSISDNTATYNGGGVHSFQGNITMSGGSISNNKAGFDDDVDNGLATYGGGVFMDMGTLTLTKAIITENEAASGGGISLLDATLNIGNEGVISNNTANYVGGGVFKGYEGRNTSTIHVKSGGIVDGNKATWRGGGICYYESETVGPSVPWACQVTIESGAMITNNHSIEGVGGGIASDGSFEWIKDSTPNVYHNLRIDSGAIFEGNTSAYGFSGENLKELGLQEWSNDHKYGFNNDDISYPVRCDIEYNIVFFSEDNHLETLVINEWVWFGTPLMTAVGGNFNTPHPFVEEYPFIITGWNTKPDGNGDVYGEGSRVLRDLVLYAQLRDTYTVTFDGNGATTGDYPHEVDVKIASPTLETLPIAPARDGYTFAGWNTEANGSGSAFTAPATLGGDITVYAQWESNAPDEPGGDTGDSEYNPPADPTPPTGTDPNNDDNYVPDEYPAIPLSALPISDEIFDDGIPLGAPGVPMTGDITRTTGYLVAIGALAAFGVMRWKRRKAVDRK